MARCKLTKMNLRNIRKSREYQCLLIDLVKTGVVGKSAAEDLLGYTIPAGLISDQPSSTPSDDSDTDTEGSTEGGTEEDTISRKGRRSISVSTTCLDSVARNLTAFQELAYFTCKFYELKLNGYATIDMRIAPNSFKARLKEKSAKHDGINGIWTISFTLEEF